MKFLILSVAVLLTACSKQAPTDHSFAQISEDLCATFNAKPTTMGTRVWFPTFSIQPYVVCTKEGKKEKLEITLEFK